VARAVHSRPGGALWEVACCFLRLGVTAFGGPAAHIAMMEEEAVRRRGWLGHDAFLDLLGAVNLIPGPSSTQLAMSLGYRRAGWAGLVLGGVCFILPAALITLGISWAYVRFGRLPQLQGLLYGLKPAVVAVVFGALLTLGRSAVKSRFLLALGLLAFLGSLFGLHPLAVLASAGCLGGLQARLFRTGSVTSRQVRATWLPLTLGAAGLPSAGLAGVFLFFLKVGAVVFGGGYVLLAFLKADLVDRWHWLSQAQLLDAVAVGQVTPGPVFTTATFIGYLLRGLPGAAVATLGIFLPSFLLAGFLGPLIPHLRRMPVVAAALDGINVGALALMAAVTWSLAGTALVDRWTALVGLASGILLLRFKIKPTWLLLGGAVAGLLLHAAT
jgi:chromate transporter